MSCPICDAEPTQKYRPFCSRRCADMDLARWMNGSYAIPSEDPQDQEAALDALEQSQTAPDKPH